MSIISNLAQLSSLINSFNPVPVLAKAVKTKNTEQINLIRLASVAEVTSCLERRKEFTSLLWLIYGVKIDQSAVINSSLFVGSMHIIYSVVSFVLFKKYLYIPAFLGFLVFQYFTLFYFPATVLGTLATIIQVSSALTQTSMVKKALEEGPQVINLKQQFMAFPACIIWTLLGIQIMDIPSIICAGLDLVFCIAFVLLANTTTIKKKDKQSVKQQVKKDQ